MLKTYIVHFWLHYTAHLCTGSLSAEKMGQEEMGRLTQRVLHTARLSHKKWKRVWPLSHIELVLHYQQVSRLIK